MASSYPGSLDSFDTIASDKKTSDAVGGRTHRQMHNDLGDAIEAVQTELGTDPAGSFSTVKARLDALVAYSAKTGAYTATAADHTLNVTSGTFTLDLPAASTCTGQSLRVRNSGSGVVTVDGNSSETVHGVATFPLGPGSYVEITSTGSAWIVTGGVPDTGWRDVSSGLINSWGTGTLKIRRVGSIATAVFADIKGASSFAQCYSLPSGFASVGIHTGIVRESYLTAKAVMVNVSGSSLLTDQGIIVDGTAWTSGHGLAGSLSWNVDPTTWPTSLPGAAA